MELNELLSLLPPDEATRGITRYLHQFGYLDKFAPEVKALQISPETRASSMMDLNLNRAVIEVQKMLGVDINGEFTPQTLKACLTIPRCGRPDYQAVGEDMNRWALSKAHDEGIAYCIEKYIHTIPEQSQRDIMAQAWQAWEKVCRLKIFAVDDPADADILISCSNSRNEEFGTVGNVLAWAFLPQGPNWVRKLKCKFDLAETWAIAFGGQGILLLAVATHEFGHLLGHDHTQIRNELMFPTYNPSIWTPQARFDVPESVRKYGLPVTVPTPPPLPPPADEDDIDNYELIHKITGKRRPIGPLAA